MLLLAIMSTIAVLLVYFSFFTAIVFSALCIILMFILIYKKQGGVFIFCGVLLLLTVLSTSFKMSEIDRFEKLDGVTASGEFICVEESSVGGSMAITAEVKRCEYLKARDRVLLYYEGPEILEGQSFKGRVKLQNFNDKMRLNYYSQDVFVKGDLSKIVLTSDNDFVLSGISKVKSYIKTAIFDGFGREGAATMLALLTGDKSYFTDTFYSNVKAAGVAHVMVVSGMHLAVIVSFLTYFLNKLFYNRYLKAFIIFITVIAIFAVCGFTMSMLRAGITYILISLALLLNRQSKSENNLGTAVSIILLFNPLIIFNVAFQLSVLSTFGILVVAIPIIEFITQNEIIKLRPLSALTSSVIISISALLFTLPVTILVFGYVSNMAVLTNLLISLPTTAAICLCIAGLIIPPLRPIAFYIANLIIGYVNFVINSFGGVSFATSNLPKWVLILSIIAIFLILFGLLACANQNNMLKLKGILNKKIKEGGGKRKWQSLMKKRLKM